MPVALGGCKLTVFSEPPTVAPRQVELTSATVGVEPPRRPGDRPVQAPPVRPIPGFSPSYSAPPAERVR